MYAARCILLSLLSVLGSSQSIAFSSSFLEPGPFGSQDSTTFESIYYIGEHRQIQWTTESELVDLYILNAIGDYDILSENNDDMAYNWTVYIPAALSLGTSPYYLGLYLPNTQTPLAFSEAITIVSSDSNDQATSTLATKTTITLPSSTTTSIVTLNPESTLISADDEPYQEPLIHQEFSKLCIGLTAGLGGGWVLTIIALVVLSVHYRRKLDAARLQETQSVDSNSMPYSPREPALASGPTPHKDVMSAIDHSVLKRPETPSESITALPAIGGSTTTHTSFVSELAA